MYPVNTKEKVRIAVGSSVIASICGAVVIGGFALVDSRTKQPEVNYKLTYETADGLKEVKDIQVIQTFKNVGLVAIDTDGVGYKLGTDNTAISLKAGVESVLSNTDIFKTEEVICGD